MNERARRRAFLSSLLAVPAAFAAGASSLAAPGGEPLPWLVGTAGGEITPPLEVGLLMSSGRGLWEPFEGVRLPLLAHVVVVSRGTRRVACGALDLLGLAGEAVGGWAAFKSRIAAAAGPGWSPDQIVLACTHTHTGPESVALTNLYHREPFQRWAKELADRIGGAIRKAGGGLRPCRLLAGSVSLPGLSLNRRLKTPEGRMVRNQGPARTQAGQVEGPTDDGVHVAAFLEESGRPAAILVNATAHPVYEMCIKQVSPDYPGELVRALGEHFPGAEVLFLQGAAGNINPPQVSAGAEAAREHGRRLAEAARKLMPKLRPVPGNELSLRWRSVDLPARTVAGLPAPEPLAARIGLLQLGAAHLVFLSGEPFVEIGLAIRHAAEGRPLMVVGYAEDYIGYIPTDTAMRNGGYEVGPGRWSRAAAGSELLLRQAAIELLRQPAAIP